jgi:CheY-like chemotaxis protein
MLALQAAKAEAEEANTSKTRFLAAAAHDLLQPLNAAKLFAALLNEHRDKMPPEQSQLVGRVESGLLAVEDLLSAILDISRLDTAAPEPKPEDFPIAQLFDALKTQFAQTFADEGLQLRFAKTALWVRSDPALLRRILQNFVSNARRYTRSGGVLVGCRRDNGQVTIQVIDTGVGIAEEDQKIVFEEFRRLDGRGKQERRGLGLGLAIVDRIAELLGHEVRLRSQAGKGSCFEITVPRATAAERPQLIPAKAVRGTGASLGGEAIFCIDNDQDILDGMHGLLTKWGAEAFIATSRPAALSELMRLRDSREETPAVLLVDYHLDDGVTGLEVISALRAEAGERIPAIILTADHSEEVTASVLRAGHTILRKPVRPAALRALINRVLIRRDVA